MHRRPGAIRKTLSGRRAFPVAVFQRSSGETESFLQRLFPLVSLPRLAASTLAPPAQGEQRGRRPGGEAGPQAEHKFEVMSIDRKTGKILWQKLQKLQRPMKGITAHTEALLQTLPLPMVDMSTYHLALEEFMRTTSTES